MTGRGEKRRIPRVHVLLDVTFSDGKKDRNGTTMNLSRRGLSISSAYVVTPGLRVSGKINLPSGAQIDFNAEIMWARKSRSTRQLAEQHTMGMRFVDLPGAAYQKYLLEELAKAGVVENEPADDPSKPVEFAAESLTPTAVFPVGLEGRTMAVVSEGDLACPPDAHEASLSMPRAAALMEEAVLRALAPHMPAARLTLGIAWELAITHNPSTPAGTPLVAIATLVDASSSGQRLKFHVTVKAGIREVASGTHTRVLVKRRAASKP